MPLKKRILLADDHALILAGVAGLLQPEFEVVGTVNDGRSLVREARRLKPDVVILDIGMPLLNGIEPDCPAGTFFRHTPGCRTTT